MTTDPDTGLDNDQLMQLGALTYWSGQAEAGLSNVAALLVGGDVADTVVRGRSTSELLDLCARLIVERAEFAAERSGLEGALRNVTRAMSMRNVFVHGFWNSAEILKGEPASVRLLRRAGERMLTNQTAGEIHRAAQALADATLDIYFSYFNLQSIQDGHPPQERGSFPIDWPRGT